MLVIFSIATSSHSQTIDTTFKNFAAVKVVPFKAKFTDNLNVDHLCVKIINDNLKDNCTLYWGLADANQNIHDSGNVVITGEDYASWSGDNLFPFKYVAKLFNLVFDNQ